MRYFFPIHLDGGNRGCEAIAKGTALVLKEKKENLIGLCTNMELDHWLKIDDHITLQPMRQRSMPFRIENRIYKSIIHDDWKRKSFIYRYEYRPFLEQMTKDDIMISTGGDMMCYDENQVIYTVDYLHKRGIHSILWGCSIGKNNISFRKLQALKQFSLIYARETLTQEVLSNLHIDNVVVYPDPAFALEPIPCQLPECFSRGRVIGINLSNYVMGGFDLNSAFAKEVDTLIKYILQSTDYHILLIPHVMWQTQDDRIISSLIKEKHGSNRISILNSDILNYCQIRYVISKCHCFIGARTHAVISAYSTCTPVIAIGYSIKSKGIAKDTGMPDVTIIDSVNIKTDALFNAFHYILSNGNDIKQHLNESMAKYKAKCWNTLDIIKNSR